MSSYKMAFIAAAALASAGAQAAGSLTATFDGFCDGFSVQWGSNNVAYGTETGCVGGAAVGTRGFIFQNGGGGTLTLSLAHVAGGIYVIRKDGTWTIYLADGSELQSGTWTAGARTAPAGAKATGQQ